MCEKFALAELDVSAPAVVCRSAFLFRPRLLLLLGSEFEPSAGHVEKGHFPLPIVSLSGDVQAPCGVQVIHFLPDIAWH